MIKVARLTNKTTFRTDFPSSTNPFIENILFKPFMGLILLPLNEAAFGAKFIPPQLIV